MYQRGDRYPANLPKFLSIPNPICICSALCASFLYQFGLYCFLFCRAAPLEKLVYILAVITAELVLRVFIQTVKMSSAALTQLQQLQQQAHFLQRVLLLFVSFCGGSFSNPLTFCTRRLFVSLGIMCLCPLGRRFSVQQCFQAAARTLALRTSSFKLTCTLLCSILLRWV